MHDFYMDIAFRQAEKSYDSTKYGAVLARYGDRAPLGTGYNTLPDGVRRSVERLTVPAKYLYMEHAELNAVYDAAKKRSMLPGSFCYITGLPCAGCAKGIIQVGCAQIFVPHGADGVLSDESWYWRDSCKAALEMFKEAGIPLTYVQHGRD